MKPPPRPILIACCGNDMAGDDGFGPAVGAALARLPLSDVDVLDVAAAPSALLDELPGRTSLVIVDAALNPEAPAGTLLEWTWSDAKVELLLSAHVVSTHGISVPDQLALAAQLGLLPLHTRIIAVAIKGATTGKAASQAVLNSVDGAVDRIRRFSLEVSRQARAQRNESLGEELSACGRPTV